jgi:hypothetical protein
MKRGENETLGPITDFLVKDHERLEGLLLSAVAQAGAVDQETYDQFRSGLLRHIGMEEKILLPAAQRLRGGEPFPIAAKLRLDHGAIASLLMPPPSAAVIATIRAVLKVHNTIEEGPGGLYETCDELAASESTELLAKLQAAPELGVLPCSDSPVVMPAVQRALERAGYGFCEHTT